jgi:peptidoglycan/xylan/chitin deacetylase (PgdA/CDA1 family)
MNSKDIIRFRPHEIALTFDDGPDSLWTPCILEILSYYKIKATFMCVGEMVQRHPEVLCRLVKEGHIVGNHSWDHPHLTKLTAEDIREQVLRTAEEIECIAGVKPCLFRPPYGDLNQMARKEILQLQNQIILWNVDSEDWKGLDGPRITSKVISHVSSGSIIVHHCANSHISGTVQALPYIIEILKEQGYTFSLISGMFGIPAYS